MDLNDSLTALEDIPLLAQALKGGGQGAAEVDTGAPTTTSGATFYPNVSMSGAPGSPPPFSPPGTLPLYSAGGESLSVIVKHTFSFVTSLMQDNS